jgi:hypothetical protein
VKSIISGNSKLLVEKLGADCSKPAKNLDPARRIVAAPLTSTTDIEIKEGITSAQIIGTKSASIQSSE